MERMFYCDGYDMTFNQDISGWCVSSVTCMAWTFFGCSLFTGQGIGAWDTSSVTNMSHMFSWCKTFTGQGIGAWECGNQPLR